MIPQDFIYLISNDAKSSAIKTKIPASFTVAEAALESGWGEHCPGFNLFGIKATQDWHGLKISQSTHEVVDGKITTIIAQFRAYKSWLESIDDHANFLLNNPRYKPAFLHGDGENFASSIQECGYATDPNYANKIISIIKTHNLLSLDVK